MQRCGENEKEVNSFKKKVYVDVKCSIYRRLRVVCVRDKETCGRVVSYMEFSSFHIFSDSKGLKLFHIQARRTVPLASKIFLLKTPRFLWSEARKAGALIKTLYGLIKIFQF